MRRFLLISLVPLVVACAGPAGAATSPKAESQTSVAPAAQPTPPPAAKSEPKVASQEKPGTGAKPQAGNAAPAEASELGRQFMQSLIAGDAGAANGLLADSARTNLVPKLPEFARGLAACAGSDLNVESSQNQSMTNVFARFASPCGRFGDLIPLLPAGTTEPSEAEKKIGACLVAFRSVNGAPRVVNFACTPA